MHRGFAAALAAVVLLAGAARAEAPAPAAITPALIQAAVKEGSVVWYTSVELGVAEAIGKAFEAKYPGIAVRIERTGAERVFQRVEQEYGSNIHAVDVIDSSDATHFLVWKQAGLLAPYLPAEAASALPASYRDPDGMFATWRATLSVMGFNTKLVPPAQAPHGFLDLLAPHWAGKLVKAHPGYSGTILTATWQIAQKLGWDYFARLGKQQVMQVQSANDPPRKLELGERAVMVDGVEYTLLNEKQRGVPVEPIYPVEGTPFIPGSCGLVKAAPHPNAARLYLSYLLSLETQQRIVDKGGLRSVFPAVREPAGRPALKDIALLPDDPAGTLAHAAEIKQRYAKDFGI